MKNWYGSSGLCMNKNNEILMVLQGKPDEEKTWSIPSGGKENNETFDACCIREIEEETGYLTKIVEKIYVKKGVYEHLGIAYEVHYFWVEIISGESKIQDPDNLIIDVAWKSAREIEELELTYPEDRDFLLNMLNKG